MPPIKKNPVKDKAVTDAVALYNQHKDMTITVESFEVAGEVLVTVKQMRNRVKGVYRPILDGINKLKNDTMADYKRYDGPLEALEGKIKGQMAICIAEQEKARREEEAKLQEQARKDAEAQQAAEAKKLEEMGEIQAAEQVREQEIVVAPVTVDNAPKAVGVSTSKKWHAEVINKKELVIAVLDGVVPESVLEPNMVLLNKMAVNLKGELNYPGVRAVSETVVSARA